MTLILTIYLYLPPPPRIAKSADIYNFAILMWEVMFEQKPFEDLQWQSDIEARVLSGQRLPIPPSHHVQPELVELIEECWQQDPQNVQQYFCSSATSCYMK